MIALSLITDSVTEPVTLAEAKAFLALDSSDTANDTLISALIKAARRFCENYTSRVFTTQTWDLWLDGIPQGQPASKDWWDGTKDGAISLITGSLGTIEVPKVPFQSLTSITTYNTSDEAQVFDTSFLVTDTDSTPGRIFPKMGQVWPVNLRYQKAVKVTFKAGYSDDGTFVPQDIQLAIKLMVSHYFENRGLMIDNRISEAPLSVRALLDSYKLRGL